LTEKREFRRNEPLTERYEKYGLDQAKREVAARADIVEIIGETVALTRKGNKYWGLCPFHGEKTSSFCVDRDKQMFYCFGCHVGGDVFSYLMRLRGGGFKETLEQLAQKVGVALPQYQPNPHQDEQQELAKLHHCAAAYYRRNLTGSAGAAARAYLTQRAVTEEIAQDFSLGYAGSDWSGVSTVLREQGFSERAILNSGLGKTGQNGRLYDFFRDRLIFPIMLYDEEAIAFGGRALLAEQQPKYLNSPESKIFSKRRNLYGLSRAREAIRRENMAILVEGYMDCIKMHQHGLKNAVASLGTAFTAEQAALLHRYTEKVLVLYDGDSAGQKQTGAALELLQNEGLLAETLVLPEEMDPDDFLSRYRREGLLSLLERHRLSAVEFKLNRLLEEPGALRGARQTQIIGQLFPDWQRLKSELEREQLVDLLAVKLKLPENRVHRELQRLKTPAAAPLKPAAWDKPRAASYSASERVLAIMLKDAACFALVKSQLGLNLFQNDDYQKLLNLYAALWDEDEESATVALSQAATEHNLTEILAKLSMWEVEEADKIYLKDFIAQVRSRRLSGRWSRLLQDITATREDDYAHIADLLIKINQQLILTRGGRIP
jgi:DNA primase